MKLNNQRQLLVRSVPSSNEKWSHNFSKGKTVLNF